VCVYAGEVIPDELYRARTKYYTALGISCCYIYEVSKKRWWIDATQCRNAAAFFNHQVHITVLSIVY
jgi:hypothetical protein